VAAGGHAPDEDARVERVTHHPDPVAEDRAPRERARRVDRDDPDLVAGSPPALDDLVAEGALAASGRPGDADDPRPAAALPNISKQARDPWIAILDHPDRASQRPGLAGHQTLGKPGFGHVSQSTGGPSA